MKEYKNKKSFELAFKKFVSNFDETKLWFNYKKDEVEICFVEDGKLKKFPMYKNDYYIHLDGWRFIEYLNTGKFPLKMYVMVYAENDINPRDINRVFEFEHIETNIISFDMFHYNNKIVNDFLEQYRLKYPDCGLKHLPKPETSPYCNSAF